MCKWTNDPHLSWTNQKAVLHNVMRLFPDKSESSFTWSDSYTSCSCDVNAVFTICDPCVFSLLKSITRFVLFFNDVLWKIKMQTLLILSYYLCCVFTCVAESAGNTHTKQDAHGHLRIRRREKKSMYVNEATSRFALHLHSNHVLVCLLPTRHDPFLSIKFAKAGSWSYKDTKTASISVTSECADRKINQFTPATKVHRSSWQNMMIIIILQTSVGARPGNTELFLCRSSSLTVHVSLCKYLGVLAQQNKEGFYFLLPAPLAVWVSSTWPCITAPIRAMMKLY